MRAIASARRLCRRTQARCTVVWEWGDFTALFAAIPDIEFIPQVPPDRGTPRTHEPSHVQPSHTVDVSCDTVLLRSGYAFWGSDEGRIFLSDLRHDLPTATPEIAQRVDTFVADHGLAEAVGIHMRRTDNKCFRGYPPDEMFFAAARDALARGHRIFLASDNAASETQMRTIAGDRLITHAKRTQLSQRWPRLFDLVAAQDDIMDLFLLSRTAYILGTHWSSYSGVAMAINGSQQNRFLKQL